MNLLYTFQNLYEKKNKALAVLIDPDKIGVKFGNFVEQCQTKRVDFFFLGGSLVSEYRFKECIDFIHEHSTIPAVIFPGNRLHIESSADGILLLSLISGRNSEFLIGQHVVAAPLLKRSGLEILPTGYILVDGGNRTTVQYMSNTFPIPNNKPEVAVCTAMAGEMLGLKFLYMDAGSGADNPVSEEMITKVCQNVNIPLIVGGGIQNGKQLQRIFESGATVAVVGNALEKNPDLLSELIEIVEEKNNSLITKA